MKNIIKITLFAALSFCFTTVIAQDKTENKEKNTSSSQAKISQKKAVFNGQIKGLTKDFAFMVIYLYNDNKDLAMDSVVVDGSGKFSYSRVMDGTVMARLYEFSSEQKNVDSKQTLIFPKDTELVFSPGKEVTLFADAFDPSKLTWEGNPQNLAFQQFQKQMAPLKAEEKKLSYEVVDKRGQQEAVIALTAKIDVLREKMHALSMQFVVQNPDNYGGLHDLEARQNHYDNKGDKLAEIFGRLSSDLQMTARGQAIKSRLTNKKESESGAIAPVFSALGQNDEQVDLAALKGKIMVLDFWGSWCGPCRASHPGLIKLYHKYKGKGLEIIGVADEGGDPSKAKVSWLKAIKEDEVGIWPHILNDREKAKINIVKAYSIGAFPTKVLIGKDGKIIDRYVGIGGSDLMKKKLEELFGF